MICINCFNSCHSPTRWPAPEQALRLGEEQSRPGSRAQRSRTLPRRMQCSAGRVRGKSPFFVAYLHIPKPLTASGRYSPNSSPTSPCGRRRCMAHAAVSAKQNDGRPGFLHAAANRPEAAVSNAEPSCHACVSRNADALDQQKLAGYQPFSQPHRTRLFPGCYFRPTTGFGESACHP